MRKCKKILHTDNASLHFAQTARVTDLIIKELQFSRTPTILSIQIVFHIYIPDFCIFEEEYVYWKFKWKKNEKTKQTFWINFVSFWTGKVRIKIETDRNDYYLT